MKNKDKKIMRQLYGIPEQWIKIQLTGNVDRRKTLIYNSFVDDHVVLAEDKHDMTHLVSPIKICALINTMVLRDDTEN